MPDPVFYIRGIAVPPVDNFASSPEALADLKLVATLSDDLVSKLRDRLSAAEGFLDPKKLAATVRSLIKSESTALAVHRTLQSLAPSDVEQLVKALAQRQQEEEDVPLDESELGRLRKVLPALVQPCPAKTRFEKAKRLAKLTGQELESIELICDLRPIFDEDRKQIEGMMPYTRLHIVATGADGFMKSFEAELSHQQVVDLREKAAKAESKLAVLRRSVESWLPEGLPDLPLTRPPGKKASDAP